LLDVRSYARPLVGGVAVACTFALTAPFAMAATPSATSANLRAAPSVLAPANLQDDVAAAKRQLSAVSDQVQAADDALDAASAKLPAANRAIQRAQEALTAANQAVEVAKQAVAVAQRAQQAAAAEAAAAAAKVKAQQEQVRIAQEQVDAIKRQIAMVARQAYVSGNESSQLAIVLNTSSPDDFVNRLESLNRISRGNAYLFDSLTQKKAALAATLEALKKLEDAAAAKEQEAQSRANQQQAKAQIVVERAQAVEQARSAAQARKQDVVGLIAAQESKRAAASAQRRKLQRTYESLQDKLLNRSGAVRVTGTLRTPRQAIAWGMRWLGSGASYDGLCLGFADDMYGVLPGHQRQGSAIEQWYVTKRAGKAHPGDGTPPIGGQVYWDIPGYPYGHVATYAGGGMFLTTSAFSGSRVGLRTLEYINSWLGVQELGWAEPYYPR